MGIVERQSGSRGKRKDVVVSFRISVEDAELLEEMMARTVVNTFDSLGALVRHYLRTQALRSR